MRQYDDPVEVRRGEPETYAVFDLSLDSTDGRWQLVGRVD